MPVAGWNPLPILADAALREAAGRLQGKLLVGVVNSIGVRRDAKAVDLLGRLWRDCGTGVADEALTALGRIATPKAVGIVQQALKADAAMLAWLPPMLA